MPGETLTSVWQTAFALSPESTLIEKCNLRRIFAYLGSSMQGVQFLDKSFNQKIGDGMSFKDCKDYMMLHLGECGLPLKQVQGQIEETCWLLCRELYNLHLPESILNQLWLITNRLLDEESYPPIMSHANALWLSNKIANAMKKSQSAEFIGFSERGVSFEEFVHSLKTHLHNADMEKLANTVQSLHAWLVKEVIHSGYMFMRTKKQANWSNWRKYWFVLTPGKLLYSSKADRNKRFFPKNHKGEFYLTTKSKLTSLSGYRGILKKFKHTFNLSVPPYINCEFAVESETHKLSWLSSLADAIQPPKSSLTPIQIQLKQEYIDSNSILGKKAKLPYSYLPPVTEEVFQEQDKEQDSSNEGIERSDVFYKNEKAKIRAVFFKIDKNGDGILNREEFEEVIKEFGLSLEEKEINLIFQSMDKKSRDHITFDEFCDYFAKNVFSETETNESVSAMRKAFLMADRDGKGTLNFKEFAESVWERKRSIRMSRLFKQFDKMKRGNSSEITFDAFKAMSLAGDMGIIYEVGKPDEDSVCIFEKKLKETFDDTESQDLANYIRQRWDKFASFKRAGTSGTIVMQGGHGMVNDVVPGDYNLLDLACFSDLPPLIPKHTIVKGVKWEKNPIPNTSGKLIFPPYFDGNVITEFATSERLRYYGCSFADDNQEKISLLYRHGIQDFTYENKYLSDYVITANGGSGLERHDFSHLDCPLVEDSGHFILAKLEGDELHITAFKVPVRHTIYIPGGCIHSNDYLTGTWRTMLSDEADIDHVHIVRPKKRNVDVSSVEHFLFEFLEQ